MRSWHHGWSLARGFAAAEERDGVLRTHVGVRGRDAEYLVLRADEHPRRIDRAAQRSWDDRDPWVSVPTADPGRTADRLVEHGLVVATPPEWLMQVDLRDARRVPLPQGYAVRTVRDSPEVLELALVDGSGSTGATGQLGVAGDWAVPDTITTGAAHRRRGLGSALMTLLVRGALDRGAERGALVASQEGRRLYERLGWTLTGAVVVGRRL